MFYMRAGSKVVCSFLKGMRGMSRVKKPGNKYMNTTKYDSSVTGPSKMVRISAATAGSCFSERMQENQGLWEFERGFLYQI